MSQILLLMASKNHFPAFLYRDNAHTSDEYALDDQYRTQFNTSLLRTRIPKAPVAPVTHQSLISQSPIP
jgi:hypothetical protein